MPAAPDALTPRPRPAPAPTGRAEESADPTWPTQRYQVLYDLLRAAMRHWHGCFLQHQGAQQYLASRGWPDPIALATRYQLGYAPGRGDAQEGFVRRTVRDGFPGTTDAADLARALVAAGLARRAPDGALRDLFYGRLMFPIARTGTLEALTDDATAIVGFGGRWLPATTPALRPPPDRKPPKYINTPETVLFKKRQVLYGGSWAKAAVQAGRRVVVLEGYMDYLRVREAGVPWAVACCGTALTEAHVVRLAPRLSAEGARSATARHGAFTVILMTDADAAGRRAAERGARVVVAHGLRALIAKLEGGKDPDDILRDAGPEAGARFAAMVDAAQTPILNYLEVLAEAADGPAWNRSLRGLVATMRNVQRRGTGAQDGLLHQDAVAVSALFGAAGLAISADHMLDLLRHAPAPDLEGRDDEVGA